MHDDVAGLYARTAKRVAALADMHVGPALISQLRQVAREPMDSATAVNVTAIWTKVGSWVEAQKMISTSDAVTGVRGSLVLADKNEAAMLTAQEIACATHTPYATVANQVALVERVSDCLPGSWEALDRGDLTFAHLKAIERETRSSSPRVAQLVDEHVVPRAIERGWTPSETAKGARKLVIAIDPKGTGERAAAAAAESDVQVYARPDGMASLAAHGEARAVYEISRRVNAEAASMKRAGDNRPVGIRRMHALHGLVVRPESGKAVAKAGSGKASKGTSETQVRMDLSTLLGYDDKPAELVGYGPIPASMARRIAADSTLRRLVTDPLAGDVIDLGLRSYRPSAALRRMLEAEHPTCSMPGCSQPAYNCEADHRDERQDGGRTDRCNLKPLCKMHHQMKSKKRWKVDVNPDGSETWTSYLGFTYTKASAFFPLPDAPPIDDDLPAEVAERLPEAFDPDPPRPEAPLPEPPALTDEDYDEADRALSQLDLLDISYRRWVDAHYDEMRATGLVA